MQILGKNNLFQEIKYEAPKSKARGERSCLIEDFCKELDKDVGQVYKDKNGKLVKVKKSNPTTVAFFLSHLTVGDLYYFLSSCRQAKCGFRRAYYGGLKTIKQSYPQRGSCANKSDSV